uniref:G-protein coupled receptors family 1 profile domain-containing protein n=1 Tax=Leptobrachium leishanense TaxID=445787 RepID=A0A8C5M6P3_9ANUR
MDPLNPNTTGVFSHSEFLLLGFPGLSKTRQFLVLPFLTIYLVILAGNSLVISRIWAEKSLHSPMYVLIALLFAVNISSTSAILPKFLLGLAFHWNQVTLSGCLVQMFSIYFFAIFESGIILFMALDRYVAICRPLHYHDIMTMDFLGRLIFIGMTRSSVMVIPLVVLASTVHFCGSNIILNFACENMGLINLACSDTSLSQIVGMAVRVIVTVGDAVLLVMSYAKILHAAMKIAVGKARHKALQTCSNHLSVAMMIYVCAMSASIVMDISVDVQNLTSAIYYLFPALIHPVIYGLRVKEIKVCILKAWKTTRSM